MKSLESYYDEKINERNDISEHLPTLKKYSEECDHITEMGVRDVVSTYAFMMARPKKLVSIDIMPITVASWNTADENELIRLGKENNIDFKFILGDTLKLQIEETDLLFIDTEHNYLQLKEELLLHGKKAGKYIIFHDTVTFGHRDSSHYGGRSSTEKTGLIPAINEFLEANTEWCMHEHFLNNNGLMVIKKK